MKRYFEILGLCPGATLDEVRQAYRDLVRVWHPDRFSGDYRLARISEEKLKQINEAYREVRTHIESHPLSGTLEEPPPRQSAGDGEHMYSFYDYEYSPWIWTYKRISDAAEAAKRRRRRTRRIAGAGVLAAVAALGAAAVLIDLPAFRDAMPRWPLPEALGFARPGPAASGARIAPAAGGAAVPAVEEGATSDARNAPSGPAAAAPALPAPAPPEGDGAGSVPGPLGPGVRGGSSVVSVGNDTDGDAVVVLLRRESGGTRMVRNFLVPRGASRVAAEVPPGVYVLHAALGESWDGDARRFRKPSRFGASGEIEVKEDEAPAAFRDGVVARRRTSSDIRLSLGRILVSDIPETAFDGR